MIQEMIVKKGYSYVDAKNRVSGEGSLVTVDTNHKHVQGQLWKLEGSTPLPAPDAAPVVAPVTMPKEDLMKDVNNIVDKLGHLVEPPKVIIDPDAVKPGTGIEKEKAESMLDRVKQFVEKQEQENK